MTFNTRYLKKSNATMAQSIYEDISVCIGMNSFDSPETKRTYRKLFEALETRRDDFRFTYHFGKVVAMNEEWVERSYGEALDEWKMQRHKLLETRIMRHIFSSEYTDSLGLT